MKLKNARPSCPILRSSIANPPWPRRLRCAQQLMKMAVLALLAFGAIREGRGQSALDGFDPNASSRVYLVVVQPDGKILIWGNFGSDLGVPRNGIARLNTDGTLDTAFNPSANNLVNAIALQADGKILAGGFFTSIGGQPRNFIARLDATTGSC